MGEDYQKIFRNQITKYKLSSMTKLYFRHREVFPRFDNKKFQDLIHDVANNRHVHKDGLLLQKDNSLGYINRIIVGELDKWFKRKIT